MVRTQIQIPEGLYREAKRVCESQEMSLAEVCRRGLEEMTRRYPAFKSGRRSWQPPKPVHLGTHEDIPVEEWRLLANEPSYVPPGRRK